MHTHHDHFFYINIHPMQYELHATRLESLKQNVAKTLLAASTSNKGSSASTCSVLKLIDSMQRLGVAYHFEQETDAALLSLVSSSTHGTTDDLHTVALQFRILREHGISISPGINFTYYGISLLQLSEPSVFPIFQFLLYLWMMVTNEQMCLTSLEVETEASKTA